jgi:hypothetical protein
MIKFVLAAVVSTVAFAGIANAEEMKACDEATMTMVMKEVEAAPADKKEMAMTEFNMAKEKMAGGMAEDCSKHLTAASKASMKQ